MISIKPKWCAKIMNGEKTIEVRKNKALASAIQKLINENGYADIYVYCTKDKETIAISPYGAYAIIPNKYKNEYFNGKVLFKFRCYNVEEWDICCEDLEDMLFFARLSIEEFDDYSKGQVAYAINIDDLEIFNRPKELSEFYAREPKGDLPLGKWKHGLLAMKELTKAPQNFCYVEVE